MTATEPERVVEDAIRLAGSMYRMDAEEVSEKARYAISPSA